MKTRIGIMGMLCISLLGCENEDAGQTPTGDIEAPHVVATSQIEAVRYLIRVGGCNDCHTAGFMQNNNIPENDWLTGSPVGWRGPWGTTYAPNLRLRVSGYSEEQWIKMAHTRSTLPPMAWFSLNSMSDEDLKAVYAYIKSLGPKGEEMPRPLPPSVEPQTPYVSLMPQNLPQDSAKE